MTGQLRFSPVVAAVPQRTPALQFQHSIFRGFLGGALFCCGLFVWVFKLKGEGSGEDGLLPYSPLQVLIPLLGLGAVLWLLVTYGFQWPRLLAKSGSARCLVVGLGLILIGAALHLPGASSLKEVLMYLVRWLIPLFFIVFYAVARLQHVSIVPALYGIAAGALITVLAVELYRRGVSLPVTAPLRGRYSGFLNHPNQYGILTATTAPIILWFLHSRQRFAKVISAALLATYLVCLFQSLSKTNIVLFFLALLGGSLVLALRSTAKLVKTFLVATVMAVFVPATASLAFEALKELEPRAAKVVEEAFFDPTGAESLEAREGIWEEALELIQAYPLLGLGPSQTMEAIGFSHAHNLLLQIYLDAGLFGFLGMCLIVLAIVWRVLELIRQELRSHELSSPLHTLRLLSVVCLVSYVLGNSMSDSFSTATMTVFALFAAGAFCSEPPETLFA